MVPGEDLVLAGRPIRPPGPVALGIVLVVVFVIGQQAVVGPVRGAGVRPVPVGVVLVVLADLAGVRDGGHLARLVVLEGAGAVDGGLRDRPAEGVVGPGVAVDLIPGTVLDVLPFGQPAGGVVLRGGRGHDLRARQIGRPGDAGPFSRQVGGEIDSLGGDQAGGPRLLLGDLRDCHHLPKSVVPNLREISPRVIVRGDRDQRVGGIPSRLPLGSMTLRATSVTATGRIRTEAEWAALRVTRVGTRPETTPGSRCRQRSSMARHTPSARQNSSTFLDRV